MESFDERLQGLRQIDEETLNELEKEYEYNWSGILTHWESMDIIKENGEKNKQHEPIVA